jgi:hypothetical protein
VQVGSATWEWHGITLQYEEQMKRKAKPHLSSVVYHVMVYSLLTAQCSMLILFAIAVSIDDNDLLVL